jgi:hypothetical protein
MTDTNIPSGPIRATPERRQNPRLEILGTIHGRLIPLNAPVTILEISRGGFSIETSVALASGEVHEFQLTVDQRPAVVISAKVVHTLRGTGPSGSTSYVTGLQFVGYDTEERRQAVDSLMVGLFPGASGSETPG